MIWYLLAWYDKLINHLLPIAHHWIPSPLVKTMSSIRVVHTSCIEITIQPPVPSDFTGRKVDQSSYRGRDVVWVSHAPKDSLWWNCSNAFLQFFFLALDRCFFWGKIKGSDVGPTHDQPTNMLGGFTHAFLCFFLNGSFAKNYPQSQSFHRLQTKRTPTLF